MWREEFSEDLEVADFDIVMDEYEDSSDEESESDVVTIEDEESDDQESMSNYAARLRDRGQRVNYALSNERAASESETDESNADDLNGLSAPASAAGLLDQPRLEHQQISESNQQQQQQIGRLSQNRVVDNRPAQAEAPSDDAIQPATDSYQKEEKKDEQAAATVNTLDDSDDTVDTCSICFEPFTSTSEHRVVSIKCGHIFGKECIERWLKTKESKRRCPKCNQVSNKNDVRIIYAKLIAAVDTSELDHAKKQLDEERKLRMRYEQQVEEMKFECCRKENENITLKRQITEKEEMIKRFKTNVGNQVESHLNKAKMNSLNKQAFTLWQQIDLKVDGCRLIVIAEILGYIVICQPTSPNSLAKGYGLRRIPLSNFSSSDFTYLHTQQIKDMALHPVDALLLTASFDKSVKLFNLITKATMGTFTVEAKPWCVSWNKNVLSLFYVGLNNGYLLECDTVTNRVLKKINTCLDVPIKLIRYLNHDQNTNRVNLLLTSIKMSFFCEINSSHRRSSQSSTLNSTEEDAVVSMKPLPISGPIISTSIIGENNSGHILLTVRPANKNNQNNVQHYVSLVFDFPICFKV